jgi:hypothetical protein
VPTTPPKRKGPSATRSPDRRAPANANGPAGPLRRLKGVLGRPLGLERRDGQLHVVLTERRSATPLDPRPSPATLCEELCARLLTHDPQHVAKTMHPLLLVHDALASGGWSGVAALPGRVLTDAVALAETMASEESSLALESFVEGLRPLQGAAELRDERDSRQKDFKLGETVEVSESSYAEFDRLEQSWVGTTPSDLSRPERER